MRKLSIWIPLTFINNIWAANLAASNDSPSFNNLTTSLFYTVELYCHVAPFLCDWVGVEPFQSIHEVGSFLWGVKVKRKAGETRKHQEQGLGKTAPHRSKKLRKTAPHWHKNSKMGNCFVSLFCQQTSSFGRTFMVLQGLTSWQHTNHFVNVQQTCNKQGSTLAVGN